MFSGGRWPVGSEGILSLLTGNEGFSGQLVSSTDTEQVHTCWGNVQDATTVLCPGFNTRALHDDESRELMVGATVKAGLGLFQVSAGVGRVFQKVPILLPVDDQVWPRVFTRVNQGRITGA